MSEKATNIPVFRVYDNIALVTEISPNSRTCYSYSVLRTSDLTNLHCFKECIPWLSSYIP